MSQKKKIRVELRKNRSKPPRENDLTRQFQQDADQAEDVQSGERVRAKGELSRHRTIVQDVTTDGLTMPAVDIKQCHRGRVLRTHGLYNYVELDDGRQFRCTLRRLLKSLTTDERSIVTTGDIVWVRPSGHLAKPESSDDGSSSCPLYDGMIERVEPRHGTLTRASRRREHVIVANVDQLVIVMSVVEPALKPHLIDRYLASAIKGQLRPIICLNKCDLTDAVELQPLVGAYAQLGIPTVLTSAKTGRGVDELRDLLKNRATVFSGQSGVGKSSLLNQIQPQLGLRVRSVSEASQKGRHTTTAAQLIRLEFGGWVVDTPGVRQLQLWDTRPEEIEGFFPEFAPFVPLCGFPNCTHIPEIHCAVKAAVDRRLISLRRYQSYVGMFHGIQEE